MSWNPQPPPNGQPGMLQRPPMFQTGGQMNAPPAMGPPVPTGQPGMPPMMNPVNGQGQYNVGPPKPGPPPTGMYSGFRAAGSLPPRPPTMMTNGPQHPPAGGLPPAGRPPMAPATPDSPQIARPPPTMQTLQRMLLVYLIYHACLFDSY